MTGDAIDSQYQTSLAAVNAILSAVDPGFQWSSPVGSIVTSALPANQAAALEYGKVRDQIAYGYQVGVNNSDDMLRQSAANVMQALAKKAETDLTPAKLREDNFKSADDISSSLGITWLGQGFQDSPLLGGNGKKLSYYFPSLPDIGIAEAVVITVIAGFVIYAILRK